MAYERTQHAVWMWIIPLAIIALILAAWSTDPHLAMALPAAVVIVPVLLLGATFTRLTIRVDADAVRWHFGWSFPGGSIAMGEIAGAQITQTNLFEGWGIHWTIWHGWLWNAGGFAAVEIVKTSGGGVTLGTDDPQGLFEAIERFRKGAA
jgi:hypothetical protein